MTGPACIEPAWPAPARVLAFTTCRAGGVSEGGFTALNLADHVGDDPALVAQNRSRLYSRLPPGTQVQWLSQCHGSRVVLAAGGRQASRADGCWSDQPGLACAVLTADCLPVLFCDREGSVVAAAHAGWRGLAAGILENTVAALPVAPGRLLAWLGPAIGPEAFEVGPEVRCALLRGREAGRERACFRPSDRRQGHYFLDLYSLARARLAALGIDAVYGGGHCTVTEQESFFSYRRDGAASGRMASLILLQPD